MVAGYVKCLYSREKIIFFNWGIRIDKQRMNTLSTAFRNLFCCPRLLPFDDVGPTHNSFHSCHSDFTACLVPVKYLLYLFLIVIFLD